MVQKFKQSLLTKILAAFLELLKFKDDNISGFVLVHAKVQKKLFPKYVVRRAVISQKVRRQVFLRDGSCLLRNHSCFCSC